VKIPDDKLVPMTVKKGIVAKEESLSKIIKITLISQRVMKLDRGKNLRSLDGWKKLFANGFEQVHIDVRQDCFRIPYDFVLVRAVKNV
jgi:hypothetical protein